jgi:nicotinate-nucleotide adenylyltransferase
VRIGVFGGTFDPPHLGHLIVAGDAHAGLSLDRIVFVPSAVPPHKLATVRASAEQRLEMVEVAVRDDYRFTVDDIELRRTGPSYTVDTLRSLREQHAGCELFFLIGTDALREIETWRTPDEVARLARLVALSRSGDEARTATHRVVLPLHVTRVDISATEIRRRVAAGESVRYLVPDSVREIIERDGLYQ